MVRINSFVKKKRHTLWLWVCTLHNRFGLLRSCKGISWIAWEFSKCQCLLLWLFIFLHDMNHPSSDKNTGYNSTNILATHSWNHLQYWFLLSWSWGQSSCTAQTLYGCSCQSFVVASAEVSGTPFWRPNRHKDFLVVAFNWHQHHPIFLQLLFFLVQCSSCPYKIFPLFSVLFFCSVMLMHNFLLKYQ